MKKSKFKVGDRVYAERLGTGTVVRVFAASVAKYPVGVLFDKTNNTFGFTIKGKLYTKKYLKSFPEATQAKLKKIKVKVATCTN